VADDTGCLPAAENGATGLSPRGLSPVIQAVLVLYRLPTTDVTERSLKHPMIVPMTRAYAEAIADWQYAEQYAVYSFRRDDATIKELMSGDYYACLDLDGDLMGYFCFGESAKIPAVETKVYEPGFLDIGLGMMPSLCGKGNGCSFMRSGLDFAENRFDAKKFRLSVASFNIRAIRVYEKTGFRTSQTATHRKTGDAFRIMLLG